MTAPPNLTVVVCDDAVVDLPQGVAPDTPQLHFRSQGRDAELDVQIHELYRLVLDTVRPRHADLVRLAAFVYRTDLAVSRGGEQDADADQWIRHLHLCMPVADPDFWNQAEVQAALSSTLTYLTNDQWTFAFSRTSAPAPPFQYRLFSEDAYPGAGVVTLFSGGLDSLCMLVEATLKGEQPVPLGHWSHPHHQRRQKLLIQGLNERHPAWRLPLVGVELLRRGEDAVESTQRTRGFLYGCLAAALAAEIDAPKVYLADNGPISLNLPINDQLVGAMASRATHPMYHYRLNRFLALVLATPVTVSNPLRDRTRREVLEILTLVGDEALIPHTVSCSAGRRLPGTTPHCGGCSQCIDRRFATMAAGLSHVDPTSSYVQDVFVDTLEPWDRVMTAYSYARFARSVSDTPAAEMLQRFPQLLEIVTPDDPAPETTLLEAISLVQRHATTVNEVLEGQVAALAGKLVRGKLAADSLLGKVVAEQQGRRAPQQTLRVVIEAPEPNAAVLLREATPAPHILEHQGAGWHVRYGGREVHLKNSINIARLAVLLREPGRPFSPEAIVAITEHMPGEGVPVETLGFGTDGRRAGDLVLDQTALQSSRQEILRLQQRAAQARAGGLNTVAAESEEQIHIIEAFLAKATGWRGRSRPITNEDQQLYATIRRSLVRAMDTIGEHHRSLGNHLQQAVHLEAPFSYVPEPVIQWVIRLPNKAA